MRKKLTITLFITFLTLPNISFGEHALKELTDAINDAQKEFNDLKTGDTSEAKIIDDAIKEINKATEFVEKAAIFKESTFVLGMDTLIRIFDPKFYESDKVMRSELKVFIENDIRFVVFGRQVGSQFMTLNDFLIPEEFKDRFIGITETEFREDVSSSAIKREEEENRATA
jgi:hypothetical protein